MTEQNLPKIQKLEAAWDRQFPRERQGWFYEEFEVLSEEGIVETVAYKIAKECGISLDDFLVVASIYENLCKYCHEKPSSCQCWNDE